MRMRTWGARMLITAALCLNTAVGCAQSVLTLPENLKVISEEAFVGLKSVSEIIVPDGVTEIGNAAFRDCSLLNSVTIPASVTSIASSAFINCGENLTIYAPANSYAQTFALDNGYAFVSTQEQDTTDFSYTAENGEATILEYTGSETGTLKIPATLGGYPVTSIASSAFFNCSASRVIIPQGVRTLASSSFAWCTSLTSVVIPETVTQISSSAFQNCHISLVIEGQPGSAAEAHARLYGVGFMNASTGELLFDHDYGYMLINDEATLTAYNTQEEVPVLPTEVDGYPVTAIGDSVMWNNNWVKVVNIPQGIKKIGSSFLSYCYGLTEVTLPEGLTSIGSYSMNGCPLLTSITIPASVTSIGMGTFSNAAEGFIIYGNTGSAAQTFAEQNGIAFESIDETPLTSFTYTIEDEQVTITGFTGGETEIVLPKEIDGYPVTVLGSGVFAGCTAVKQVKIPESVTVLGDSVFSGCTALVQVNIPQAVTEIGAFAFEQCTALDALALPKGLKTICASAFAHCTGLTQIVIPEGVETIGSHAFSGCSMLSSARIAQTVTSIGDGAFDACSAALQITGYAGGEAERYASENNIAFNAIVETNAANFTYTIADGEATITGYTGSETQIMIPRYIDGCTVTTIGDSAFELSKVTHVVLQDSVTTIERSAFYWCKDLLEIWIPDSVTSISNNVFSYAHSDLKIVGALDSAAQTYAWDNAIGFVDEATGKTIFDNDFAYMVSNGKATLTRYTGDDETVVVPATIDGYPVERVMSGTMQQADEMKSVSFDAQITEIEQYLMTNCDRLIYVKLPGSVQSIAERAFSACYELERIDIPESVTSIDATAFAYCDRLTIYGKEGSYAQTFAQENGIAFKSLDDIGDGFTYVQEENRVVITGYTGTQTEIVVPAEIDYTPVVIGSNAFENNTALTSVTISEGIEEIGASAFEGCTNLSNLTLCSSLTHIGSRAFARCEKLTEVVLPSGVTAIETALFEGCMNLSRVDLPDNISRIGAGAFAACSSLSEIVLPSALTAVEENAFKDCTSLTAVDIPQGTTSIGSYAYAGNTMLSSAVIPASVTSIGMGAFDGCSEAFCMTVDEGSYAYAYAVENSLAYKINTIYTYTEANDEVIITGYDLSKPLGKHMIIPDTIDGMPVTAIADDAFTWSSYVTTSVTLPHTVRAIGARAFTGLAMLESVSATGVTSIGESAFSGCNHLIDMPIHEGLTTIGTRAFSYCQGAGVVTLPASLTEIGDYAFESCTGIEAVAICTESATFGTNIFNHCTGISNVVFESDMTEIPKEMFNGCTALTSLRLPAAVESIGVGAFAGTTALCDVEFPETLSIIGESAFSFSGLESLELPENLTIGVSAFSGTAIRELYVPQSTVTVGAGAFSLCANLTQITLPTQQIDIGTGLFRGCTALETLALSSLEWEVIPKGMFSDCTSLRSVILPNSAKYIRADVFNNCTSLESVIFGDQLLQIEEYAFKQCTSLKTVELPESLISLKEGVFYQSGLTQIRIPDSVVYLAEYMFYECFELEHVEFGTGSKVFYELMLYRCPNMREVIFYGDVKTIPRSFMYEVPSDVVIYGYGGTAAQTYAQDYNYTFYAIPQSDTLSSPKKTAKLF